MTPTPEEPLEEGPDQDNSGKSPYDADPALRGWIDPDDRLWRHPSELAARTPQAGGTRPPLLSPPSPRHAADRRRGHSGRCGLGHRVARPFPGPLRARRGRARARPTIPLTTLAARSETVPARAQPAGESMVQLRAVTNHGVVPLVGVAVAEGGLVATTADGLAGLRSISMIASDGRSYRASLVGVDDASDIALVSVPDDVPVATVRR